MKTPFWTRVRQIFCWHDWEYIQPTRRLGERTLIIHLKCKKCQQYHVSLYTDR